MPICAMPCDEETRRIKVGFASPPEQRELETLSVSELGLLAETLALAEISGKPRSQPTLTSERFAAVLSTAAAQLQFPEPRSS